MNYYSEKQGPRRYDPLPEPPVTPMPRDLLSKIEAWMNPDPQNYYEIGRGLVGKLNRAWHFNQDRSSWEAALSRTDPRESSRPVIDLIESVKGLDGPKRSDRPALSDGDLRRIGQHAREKSLRASELSPVDYHMTLEFSEKAFRSEPYGPGDVAMRDDGTMAIVGAGSIVDRLSGQPVGYEVITRGGPITVPPEAYERWSFALPIGQDAPEPYKPPRNQRASNVASLSNITRGEAARMIEKLAAKWEDSQMLDQKPRCLGGDPPVR